MSGNRFLRILKKCVRKECIIATNSSTLVVTEMSSELEHKERCVSLHISTTAPGATVVEVARAYILPKSLTIK